MPNDLSYPYRNPALPLAKRVADLLARMSLEEKVAQLGAIWLNDVLDEHGFVAEKAQAVLANGIGQVVRPAGGNALRPPEVAQANAQMQAYLAVLANIGRGLQRQAEVFVLNLWNRRRRRLGEQARDAHAADRRTGQPGCASRRCRR